LLLFLIDVRLARRSTHLRVRRDRPARLSLGADNDIVLILENLTNRALRIIVRDMPPAQFRAEPSVLDSTLGGRRTVRLTYNLLPTERGDFPFGDIHLRIRGPLGLAWIDRAIPAAETVPVYPNLLEVRRYEALLRSTLTRTGGYRTRRFLGGGRE